MKYFFLSCAIIGVFILQSCASQKGGVLNPTEAGGWLIGPVAGVNLVSYKTDQFDIISSEQNCFTAQNGSDVAFHAGLTAEVPLDPNTMQNYVVGEVLFDSKSSKFTTANNTRANIPTKLNGVVQNGSVTTDETATLNYGLLNVGYKYNFTSGPSPVGPAVQLCLSAGIPLTVTLNKTVTVAASSGSTPSLKQETRAASVPDASNGVSTGIRFGLRGQFDYDIPLTGDGSWTLTPAVGYDQPFTKVDNSAKNWMASAAYGSVAIRYMMGR